MVDVFVFVVSKAIDYLRDNLSRTGLRASVLLLLFFLFFLNRERREERARHIMLILQRKTININAYNNNRPLVYLAVFAIMGLKKLFYGIPYKKRSNKIYV